MRELEAKDGGQVAEQTFEEWYDLNLNQVLADLREGEHAYYALARAAWQAALRSKPVEVPEAWSPLMNAQASPVDWEQRVKEKFPYAWSHSSGILSAVKNPIILGYSWQHAAHHPDVIGEIK